MAINILQVDWQQMQEIVCLHEKSISYLILCCMFLVIFAAAFLPTEYHLQIKYINNRNTWNHSVLICCPVVLGSFLTLLCGVCFPFLKAWPSLLAVYMWKDQHNLWIETGFKYINRSAQTGYWILCLLLYIVQWNHIFCRVTEITDRSSSVRPWLSPLWTFFRLLNCSLRSHKFVL